MATDAPIRKPGVLITGEDDRLALVRTVAKWMDSAFELPGTKIKVGLDAIIGLIPGIGDLVTSAIGGYIVLAASQMGVSKVVIMRMLANLGIDTVIGAVPLVGDLLDVGWKANLKNAALLEQALKEPQATRRASFWAVAGLGAAFVGIVAGAVALGVLLVKWVT